LGCGAASRKRSVPPCTRGDFREGLGGGNQPTPALRHRCRCAPPLRWRGFSGEPPMPRCGTTEDENVRFRSREGTVKKLKSRSCRRKACAGAPAPPGWPNAFFSYGTKIRNQIVVHEGMGFDVCIWRPRCARAAGVYNADNSASSDFHKELQKNCKSTLLGVALA
jgi:hypothetical protein